MEQGTSPDDEKMRPQKGDGKSKDDSGGSMPENAAGSPFDLTQFGFGKLAGGDESEVPANPKRPKAINPEDVVLTEEELREEAIEMEETRQLFESVGITPLDKSQLVEGPPLTAEDYAALWKLERGQLDGPEHKEERHRLWTNVETFKNWHEADCEILLHMLREQADEIRSEN